ncbi:hypothetical protein [Frankia sp. Cr1]|uniref:hypothetical protein n=1 Tax=Frankia sp. Cr1 TaxID=3073931 RepID=UPI002AD38798|nr:hypothetical protein [Frankia sp. Cr1]
MSTRTGLTDVDSLIKIRDAEQAALDELVAIGRAKDAIAGARQRDLVAEQTTAYRRWTAAKGLLTKAQKCGNPGRIAAAQARTDSAYAEFDRISATNIAELQQIATAQSARLDRMFDQIRRTGDARAAVIEALARPQPSHGHPSSVV